MSSVVIVAKNQKGQHEVETILDDFGVEYKKSSVRGETFYTVSVDTNDLQKIRKYQWRNATIQERGAKMQPLLKQVNELAKKGSGNARPKSKNEASDDQMRAAAKNMVDNIEKKRDAGAYSPEERADLEKDFFDNMKKMIAGEF